MKEGWEVKKLGEVATYVNGYAFKPTQWGESGVPIIRIQNLNNSDALYNYYDGEIPSKYVVEYGDILISWSASLGVYEWKGQRSYLNQHIFKVVFDKIDINKYFLKYAVSGKLAEMLKDAHGATMKHVVKKDFDNTKIIYPPLPEQSRIVEELDLLSNIIEKKRQQLSELDNLAQSIFYDMFGDPVTNEKGWEVKRLDMIVSKDCPISYGIVQPGEDVMDGIPIVRPIDLIDTYVRVYGLKKTKEEISKAYKRTILRGDELLLCVRGTTGLSALATEELKGCNVTRGIVPLFFDDNNRWFIYLLLKQKSMLRIIGELTYGIALKQINIKDLRSLPIILPPLNLQQLFAKKIEAIEKQKELIKQSIAETEELFNSRMDYYFN